MPDSITPLIQQYTVDFASNNNFLFVKGIQGDGYGTRYVDISLMNNGQPYTVNDEAITAVIRGTKPDTSIVFNECEILDNNTIRVEITQQMSAVAGRGNYEISIMSNLENRTLTSFPFFIIISKSSYDVGYVVSSNEFGLLIDKINQVHKIEVDLSDLKSEMQNSITDCDRATKDCVDATNKAKEATDNMNSLNESVSTAEGQRIINENIRIAAEDQRDKSEQIRSDNENTRINAESIRDNNESIRQSAEIDRVNAEDTRNVSENDREDQEAIRQANEKIRQQQETKRQTDTAAAITNANNATTSANTASDRANAISTDLENKVATGYYKGEPGKDGVITTIEINQLAFQIIDGHLIIFYEVGNTDAEKFSISSEGHMIYTFSA